MVDSPIDMMVPLTLTQHVDPLFTLNMFAIVYTLPHIIVCAAQCVFHSASLPTVSYMIYDT